MSTSSSEEPELPYPPGAPTDPSDPNPKKLSGIIVQTGGCFAMTTESGTYALVAGPGVTLPVGSWVTVDYTPASSAGGCPGTPVTVTGAKLVG